MKYDIKRIKKEVKILDVLDVLNIHIPKSSSKELQIACPFHGQDLHPSARIYWESNSMYCWKCKKMWDVIELVRDSKKLSFTGAIEYLIDKFSLSIVKNKKTHYTKEEVEKYQFIDYKALGENKLILSRKKMPFKKYLNYCSILDKINFLHEAGSENSLKLIKKFINKIEIYG